MKNRKAQAAMEFLMTYGWAILVVLAAISALAYFGVLSPEKLLPEKCILSTGISCTGHKITSEGFSLVLTNNLGKEIFIDSIEVGTCVASDINESLLNGDKKTIIHSGCTLNNTGSKFSGDIKVMYTEKITGLSKTNTGEITSKVQAPSIQGAVAGPPGGAPGGPTPITLIPSTAQSLQDEETTGISVTGDVAYLDDNWAPKTSGTVTANYYASGRSSRYFDAIGLQFTIPAINTTEYDGKLRFYLRDGLYSSEWHHYKVYDRFDPFPDCVDESPPCRGSPSYAEDFEGWIEVSVSDSMWSDGNLSIRIWDGYVDKVELYLEPTS